MPEDPQVALDWKAGASAQVEIFSPEQSGGDTYQLKFTPPFHATIRPPLETVPLGPEQIDPIISDLDEIVARMERGGETSDLASDLELVGTLLLDVLIPSHIQAELRAGGLFLELGMDEALLAYPWELMHDGADYLCLKHALGRFVNSSRGLPPPQGGPPNRPGSALGKLSILVIGVPNPEPRKGRGGKILRYDRLPGVEQEAMAICDTLEAAPWVEVSLIYDQEATFNRVYQALKKNRYHIVHYSGHAHFDDRKPLASALVLRDRDMATGHVQALFGVKPAVLCFINGCESTRTSTWTGRSDIFGLARAFLETGSYLLGSRWKVPDESAVEFARQFYQSLVVDMESLGDAVRAARGACRMAESANGLAWASYLLYGDPRLCFRELPATC